MSAAHTGPDSKAFWGLCPKDGPLLSQRPSAGASLPLRPICLSYSLLLSVA